MTEASLYLKKIKAILKGKSNPFASSPRQFTFADWKLALVATKAALGNKSIGLLAAGIAFFSTLAFFPLIAASVAIASFVISEQDLQTVVINIEQYLPADIASLISTQLEQALTNQSANVIIAIVAILIALFSISGSVQNLVAAVNKSYDLDETRGAVKLRLTSAALLGVGLVGGTVIILLLLTNTPLLTGLGIPYWIAFTLSTVRWMVLGAIVGLLLAAVYRYAPNKSKPQWQWVSWGSVIAATLWMIGTVLFFVYARYFANFSDSYSVFAGIIVLMTWLNLSAFIVLFGAEINNQLERQSVIKKSKKK